MKITFAYLLFLLSCSAPRGIEWTEINITIESARSSKTNLTSAIYTVFFMESPDSLEIKFTLSEKEKEKILKKFNSLKLDSSNSEITFKDNCTDMPKLYQTLRIRKKNAVQIIRVDVNCDKFYGPNAENALAIKEFIILIGQILDSKPQIKNAPRSDIIYY